MELLIIIHNEEVVIVPTMRSLRELGKEILGFNDRTNVVGSFGSLTFEVSTKKTLSINGDLQRTNTARLGEHTPINGVGMIWHQGRELKTVSFPILLTSALGVDIALEIKKLDEMIDLGEYNYLILGGNVLGQFPYILSNYGEIMKSYNPTTNSIDLCEVTLELKEYIEDPAIYTEEVEYRKSIKTAVSEESELEVLEEQDGGET